MYLADNTSFEPVALIDAFYRPGSRAHRIVWRHSRQVAQKALEVAARVPQLAPDLVFIEQAALLHDIGIFLTDAPSLDCFGDHPYIAHGVLGRGLLEEAGLAAHARVCECHVGVGITEQDVREHHLPLPLRDMCPVTIEEKIVCYADKFFSKTGSFDREKSPAEIIDLVGAYGPEKAACFRTWLELFEEGG